MARKPYRLVRRTLSDGSTKVYCYHAVSGKPLPLPGTPGFDEAVRLAALPAAPRVQKQTIAGLITAFCLDVRHTHERSAATRKTYERTFSLLNTHYGQREVETITREDIEAIHRTIAYSPSFTNQFISNCNSLFEFAEMKKIIQPWQRPNLKRMKLETGEYATWEPDDIERFLAQEMLDYVRHAFLLGFYTGQRISDVLSMEWKHWKRGIISVSQIKTGARVWVPCHPNLEAMLTEIRAKNPASNFIVAVNRETVRTGYDTFNNQFSKTKKRAGLAGKDYPFHGLRKTAACMLYEAGCDVAEIRSITGHASLAMVEHYIREAKAKALAESAMRKILAQQENRFSGVHRMVEAKMKTASKNSPSY